MVPFKKAVHKTFYTPAKGVMSHYLEEISKYKILPEQEIRKLVELAKKGDRKAIATIVNANQRFVLSVAKTYSKGDEKLLSDLISEGNIGLITSIEYYNKNYGVNFLTHAVYWIKKYILFYVWDTNMQVKTTNRTKTAKVKSITNNFFMIEGRYPTPDEILDILEEKHKIKINNECDVYQLDLYSIDNIKDPNDDSVDFFNYYAEKMNNCDDEITPINDYETQTENDYSKALISKTIGVLNARELNIVKMLYGISNTEKQNIEDIAKKMNLTTEAIRTINKRALNKMKTQLKTHSQFI